jgi:hypothetical protein
MKPYRTLAAAAASLAFLGAVAVGTAASLPTTWIVDDDGGPGVNFTKIQPAIDAAADGDLILVRAGSYGDFSLSKNLTILGEEDARVGRPTLQGIGLQATVAALEFRDMWVRNCPGTVVLDGLLAWETNTKGQTLIDVENCADVRVIEADAESGWWLDAPYVAVHDGSRVEVVLSYLTGKKGLDAPSSGYLGGDGEPAVQVDGASRVHLARCTLRGGEGGDAFKPTWGIGGRGGAGLRVTDGVAIVTGRGSDLIQGGKGGSVFLYGYGGDGGDGARVQANGKLRYSDVLLKAGKGGYPWGYSDPGAALKVALGGSAKEPKRADPALERAGPPVAGGVLNLKLRSEPGCFSRLFVGTVPIVNPTPGVVIEKLVLPQTTYALGTVPATGILNYALPLDPAWTPGTVLHLQAMSIYPAGKIRRTNSVPVVVREP